MLNECWLVIKTDTVFGISADLYEPKKLDKKQKHTAVVIGPPHSSVKEQPLVVYASELVKHGFITIAFDSSAL